MNDLPASLLFRACRIFLTLAYPGGEGTIPASKRNYCHLEAGQPLEPLLAPPVCQVLPAPGGGIRGYAFRLGSATYPNLKLQITDCGQRGDWVFAVDTHDAVKLDPGHPDAPKFAQLQAVNRQLKEQIERAWESEGLLTFNGLLRRQLKQT